MHAHMHTHARTHTHTHARTHTHSTQLHIVPQAQVLNQDTDEDLPIFDVQFFYFDLLSPILLHTKIYGIAAVLCIIIASFSPVRSSSPTQ